MESRPVRLPKRSSWRKYKFKSLMQAVTLSKGKVSVKGVEIRKFVIQTETNKNIGLSILKI